jgi:vacuolar-type H+-ATPase subunit E/Vma4
MSLESILSHILNQAYAQKELITQEAKKEAERITQDAQREAVALYQNIINKASSDYGIQKQRLIVGARLEYKKGLLETKQVLIDSVFEKLKSTFKGDKFKKQQVYADRVKEVPEDVDFFLSKFRQDYESQIADMLFK